MDEMMMLKLCGLPANLSFRQCKTNKLMMPRSSAHLGYLSVSLHLSVLNHVVDTLAVLHLGRLSAHLDRL